MKSADIREKFLRYFESNGHTIVRASSLLTASDDPTDEPRWGVVGKQKVEDTGPLTKKRMETVDEEITAAERVPDWLE